MDPGARTEMIDTGTQYGPARAREGHPNPHAQET